MELPLADGLPDHDVIVVGGGMVGAAAALGLAETGLRVALVEARQPAMTFDPAQVSNRVSALTRRSENLLKKLDIWQMMQSMRIKAYSSMHVWDAGGRGEIHFDAADVGEPSLGHIVENRVTQLALWQRLQAHQLVTLFCPDTLLSVQPGDSGPRVRLKDAGEVSARLLVAADGKNSVVRDMLGIQTQGWLYDQHALVATVHSELSHRNTAWQRFMPDGPLAFLPLGIDQDHACSIVWSTSPQQAQALLAMPEQAFCEALASAGENILGNITAVSERAVYPLELKHAQTYIADGCVLLGDAAHAIHPLAGQGVNLGFEDVEVLLEQVALAKQAGRSIGSRRVLRRYERERKGANLTMLAAMDGFKRLFSNNMSALRLLRNSGLVMVDRSKSLKAFFTRYALGIH